MYNTEVIEERTGKLICELDTDQKFAKPDQLEFEGVIYNVLYTKTIVQYKDFCGCNILDKRTVYVRKQSNGDC